MDRNNFQPTFLLKTFLVLAGAVAVFTIARGSSGFLSVQYSDALALTKALLVYGFTSTLCRIVSVVGMWRGRRWGVYGYAALTILSVIVSYSISGPRSLSYLGGLVVLYIAVRPNWATMK